MATDNIETLLPQGQLRPDKEKGSFVLSKYFFVAPACGIDTTASLRMFVVTYNTKYKTYITMSKSSTISLDVLNALSPQKEC
jgi:hypothetical protein